MSLDVLLGAIENGQQEGEPAEARVAELEGQERDLREDADAVERLRQTWGAWPGALDADPVLARQRLRKVLDGLLHEAIANAAWAAAPIAGGVGATT